MSLNFENLYGRNTIKCSFLWSLKLWFAATIVLLRSNPIPSSPYNLMLCNVEFFANIFIGNLEK
jgi:hypothetical protein